MKYVVIDVETTGIDPLDNQILEFGAVIEDSNTCLPIEEIPKFKCVVQYDSYHGSPIAINMNARIFKLLAEHDSIKDVFARQEFARVNNIFKPFQLPSKFLEWIIKHDKSMLESPLNIAGKNYAAFDKLFLDGVDGWQEKVKCERRFLDPSMIHVDWKNDKRLPSLDECLKRAGVDTNVTHDALQDAIDTLLCIRADYDRKI